MSSKIAVVTKIRNEAPYLLEWIAFHLVQGVQFFRVYDNGSSDESAQLLKALGRAVPIDVIAWRQPFSDEGAREICRQSCVALSGVADFAAFIDVDEFLFSTAPGGLTAFFDQLPEDVSAVAVNQSVFGSGGAAGFVADLVTARFVRRAPLGHVENCWFKTIARPERVVHFTSEHSVQTSWGRAITPDGRPLAQPFPHPGVTDRVAFGPLRLNHYMLKSRGEFEDKKRRWTAGAQQPAGMIEKYTDGYFLHRADYSDQEEDVGLENLVSRVRFVMKSLYMTAIRDHRLRISLAEYYGFLSASEAFVLMDGDSLTQGVAAQIERKSYAADGLRAAVTIQDASVWGDTLQGRLRFCASEIAVRHHAEVKKNIVHIAAGSNDIRLGDHLTGSSSAAIAALREYCSLARAANFKVVVASILPRGDLDARQEMARIEFNRHLRDEWMTFADGFSDWAADPKMGSGRFSEDGLLCADGIHPTELGSVRLARISCAAINRLLDDGSQTGS